MRASRNGNGTCAGTICACCATALLAGCTLSFDRPAPQPAPPVARAPAAGAPAAAGQTGVQRAENQAAAALLGQSRTHSAAGDFGSAAVTVERALAIDPNNPVLWLELADIRWNQGDRDQADVLARKALTLAGSDRSIIDHAERLLSRR